MLLLLPLGILKVMKHRLRLLYKFRTPAAASASLTVSIKKVFLAVRVQGYEIETAYAIRVEVYKIKCTCIIRVVTCSQPPLTACQLLVLPKGVLAAYLSCLLPGDASNTCGITFAATPTADAADLITGTNLNYGDGDDDGNDGDSILMVMIVGLMMIILILVMIVLLVFFIVLSITPVGPSEAPLGRP